MQEQRRRAEGQRVGDSAAVGLGGGDFSVIGDVVLVDLIRAPARNDLLN
jgi:hypothetical protein